MLHWHADFESWVLTTTDDGFYIGVFCGWLPRKAMYQLNVLTSPVFRHHGNLFSEDDSLYHNKDEAEDSFFHNKADSFAGN